MSGQNPVPPSDGKVPPVAGAPKANAKPKPQKPNVPTSGVVPILRNAAQGLQVVELKERSYYLVDVQAAVSNALSFDSFVRRLNRRGGWKFPGYYASMMLRALLIKLQRVGIATNQIFPTQPEILHAKNFDFPAVALNFVDQFGCKTDVDNVEIAPLVTDGLCLYLATIIQNMGDDNSPDYAVSRVIANYKGWVLGGYGPDVYAAVAWSAVAGVLGIPFNATLDAAQLNVSIAALIARQRLMQGAVPLTGPLFVAISQAAAADPLNFFDVVAPGALAAAGAYTANFVAAVQTVRANLVSAADPMPAGAVANMAVIRSFVDEDEAQFEMQELSMKFTSREVPVNISGSFAPLCSVHDPNDDASASHVVRSVTPAEYVMGIAVHQTPIMVKKSGLPFNVDSVLGRRKRYAVTPIGMTVRELRATIWRQGLSRK